MDNCTGMEKMALQAGRKRLYDKYIDGWHFKSYGPWVYYRDQGMTEDNIKSFDEYFEDIKPKAFDTDDMLEIFETGVVSFKEFKEFFRNEFYEVYEKLVSERLEKVARENEDVRATEE